MVLNSRLKDVQKISVKRGLDDLEHWLVRVHLTDGKTNWTAMLEYGRKGKMLSIGEVGICYRLVKDYSLQTRWLSWADVQHIYLIVMESPKYSVFHSNCQHWAKECYHALTAKEAEIGKSIAGVPGDNFDKFQIVVKLRQIRVLMANQQSENIDAAVFRSLMEYILREKLDRTDMEKGRLMLRESGQITASYAAHLLLSNGIAYKEALAQM
jgi:hypothetical protein